jgi:antitoxin CptB
MSRARPVRAFRVEERMTGMTRSSEGLDARRRKILFRAWHRGMRELDLILGRFAEANIERLSERELTELENLMNVPDDQLLAWLTGEREITPGQDGDLLRRLRTLRATGVEP